MNQEEWNAELKRHTELTHPLMSEVLKKGTSKKRRNELLLQIEILDLAFHKKMIPIYMAFKKSQLK